MFGFGRIEYFREDEYEKDRVGYLREILCNLFSIFEVVLVEEGCGRGNV